jgi:hypothetical protein
MSSLFKAVLTKKEQNSQNQKSSKTSKSSATPKVKALPPDFFEQVLICEIQMKRSFSMPLLQKLINYYSQAIEYYESICDPRFARYSKSLQLLLMQPEVMKHITLQSSKGKIKVQKQERKKEIMDELHNVDKKFEKDNKDIHNLIAQKNAPEKKEDINKVINNVLDEQTNNFKKKLEEKKKRKLLNLNEESGSNDKSNSIEEKNHNNKSKEKKIKKKVLNKSFDAIGKDESIFSNDVQIEPISMLNLGETNLSLTDGINSNLEFFFNDFDDLFNEKITKNFIERLSEITKEKINIKIKTALDFAEKIKDNEFKLTFDETLDQNTKDEIGKKILELGEEQKKAEKEIDEKYKTKIDELKEEFKNQNIHNSEWVKNLKEKYSSDIDTSIYNYIGN